MKTNRKKLYQGESRPRESQAGQTLIELALLTPVLAIMLIGIVELGRFAYLAILVGNAAHAGALYGAQGLPQAGDTPDIQTAAQNDFESNGQDKSKLTVTSSESCGCDSGGTITSAGCSTTTNPSAGTCAAGHWIVMVSVTASDTFTGIFNYVGIPPLTVARTSIMRVNQFGD